MMTYHYGARGDRGPLTVFWYDNGLRPPTPLGIDPDDPLQRLGEGNDGLMLVGDKGILTCAGWSGMPRLLPMELHRSVQATAEDPSPRGRASRRLAAGLQGRYIPVQQLRVRRATHRVRPPRHAGAPDGEGDEVGRPGAEGHQRATGPAVHRGALSKRLGASGLASRTKAVSTVFRRGWRVGLSQTGGRMPADRLMRGSDSNPAGLTGERLGIYQVESLIGSGGMGEVYRARDTRLGRAVAIKVLPPAFTSNASRVARFEREARLLASLNHPHIATVYGLEEFAARGGTERVFGLVMELVDGQTLAERIRQADASSRSRHARRAAARRGAAHRRPDRRCARCRARARHRPSGSQAGERVGDDGRQRQGARFRDREARAQSGTIAHRLRRPPRPGTPVKARSSARPPT